MSSTFLTLTNKVLRKLNEVQLTSDTFADARGLQAAAKDAVNDAIRKINSQKFEWPFNKTRGYQAFTVGVQEYDWPSDLKSVDWNSFQVLLLEQSDIPPYSENPDGTTPFLEGNYKRLKFIQRDDWFERFSDIDTRDHADDDGTDTPEYVFQSAGEGFSVSPVPNFDYSIYYTYYKYPTTMSLHSDTSTVPEFYDHVIVAGAMYYMYEWKDNHERAAIAKDEFNQLLGEMTRIVLEPPTYIRDTRINF